MALDGSGRARRGVVARWVLHRVYASRGRRDGRRSLPLLAATGSQPSPTLHRLGDLVDHEAAMVHAEEVRTTAPIRVDLMRLVAPSGEREREDQRLQELLARLENVRASGPSTERRLGEDSLDDGFIQLRRRREHDRRVHAARKRVEDQRTLIASLAAKEHALRAELVEARRRTRAQVRLVGAERKAEAVTYLNGALRTHPQRRLLSEQARELIPGPPTHLTTPDEEKP